MVNTTQQVGGAVGTALLNTLFAAAITDYVATHGGRRHAGRGRDLGYGTAFGWATGIFVAGAIVTALILPSGSPRRPGAGRRVRALRTAFRPPARRLQLPETAGPFSGPEAPQRRRRAPADATSPRNVEHPRAA